MVNALQIISIGFPGVAAIRSYYVEEILASVILFAVLFGCVAVILLLLFMLGRASQAVRAFAESCGRKMRRLPPFFNRKRKDNDPDGMKERNKKRCTAIP
jgi:hypothetical protein